MKRSEWKTSPVEATYVMHEYPDGLVSARTTTSWTRFYPKVARTKYRYGEILNQAKFKAWLKKYKFDLESCSEDWGKMTNGNEW